MCLKKNFVRVASMNPGMHPGESLVEIETKTGIEEVFYSRISLDEKKCIAEVSIPLEVDEDGFVLIELPMETMSGKHRIWVDPNSLVVDF